jgi:hypothetical protein
MGLKGAFTVRILGFLSILCWLTLAALKQTHFLSRNELTQFGPK